MVIHLAKCIGCHALPPQLRGREQTAATPELPERLSGGRAAERFGTWSGSSMFLPMAEVCALPYLKSSAYSPDANPRAMSATMLRAAAAGSAAPRMGRPTTR